MNEFQARDRLILCLGLLCGITSRIVAPLRRLLSVVAISWQSTTPNTTPDPNTLTP